CWFNQTNNGADAGGVGGTLYSPSTIHGVIWNCSVDWTYFGNADSLFVHLVANGHEGAWSSPSTMGAGGSDGKHNFYVEDSDFHGGTGVIDADNNAKTVFRHCIFDNAMFNSHGYDTSPAGIRHWEFYDDQFLFADQGANSFNMNQFILVRGGTGVIADNSFENINSQAYGDKNEISFDVHILGCWGYDNFDQYGAWSSHDGGSPQYPAPRQVGFGYVTGLGHDGRGETQSRGLYVGDSEPVYIWNNAGNPVVGTVIGGECTSGLDNPGDYARSGRDFIFAVKPGYQKFAYPHPLRNGGPTLTPTPTATATFTPTPAPTRTPTA